MSTQYKVRPTFFGVLWKVVVVAPVLERGIKSIHFDKESAVKMVEFYEKNC